MQMWFAAKSGDLGGAWHFVDIELFEYMVYLQREFAVDDVG